MDMNINNRTFLTYLNNVTTTILGKIKTKDYFALTDEQKLTISYSVFNLLKSNVKININDDNFKAFIIVLRKKNEIEENYEFASILNDIIKNFNKIIEISNEKKIEIKKKKIEN